MTGAREFLTAVQARAEAATDGPWIVDGDGNHVVHPPWSADDDTYWVADTFVEGPTAEFIAAARTEVPRLVAALTAALDLAQRSRSENYPRPEEMQQRTPDYWHGANDALDSFADHLSVVIEGALTNGDDE